MKKELEPQEESLLKTLAPAGVGVLFFLAIQLFFYIIRTFSRTHPMIVVLFTIGVLITLISVVFFVIKRSKKNPSDYDQA